MLKRANPIKAKSGKWIKLAQSGGKYVGGMAGSVLASVLGYIGYSEAAEWVSANKEGTGFVFMIGVLLMAVAVAVCGYLAHKRNAEMKALREEQRRMVKREKARRQRDQRARNNEESE